MLSPAVMFINYPLQHMRSWQKKKKRLCRIFTQGTFAQTCTPAHKQALKMEMTSSATDRKFHKKSSDIRIDSYHSNSNLLLGSRPLSLNAFRGEKYPASQRWNPLPLFLTAVCLSLSSPRPPPVLFWVFFGGCSSASGRARLCTD